MLEKNCLLAAVRYLLPESQWLTGKNNRWTVVTNRYLMVPDEHFGKYAKVSKLDVLGIL